MKQQKYQDILDMFEEKYPKNHDAKEGDVFKIEVIGDFNSNSCGAAYDRLKYKGFFVKNVWTYKTTCFVFEKVNIQINRWLTEPMRFFDHIGLERTVQDYYIFTEGRFNYEESKLGKKYPAHRYITVNFLVPTKWGGSKTELYRYENNII